MFCLVIEYCDAKWDSLVVIFFYNFDALASHMAHFHRNITKIHKFGLTLALRRNQNSRIWSNSGY